MASLPSIQNDPSIVDTLIEERAPTLLTTPGLRQLVRLFLDPVLRYREAVDVVEQIKNMSGSEIMDLARSELSLNIGLRGGEHIAKSDAMIIAANHPTGIADGIAVYDVLSRYRDDVVFLANRDAIRLAGGLADVVIPVEWVKEKRNMSRTRETFRHISKAFSENKAVVIFPSGRMSHLTSRGLREREWLPTVINLARKYRVPIAPMHIASRNSTLFYAFSQVSDELRDVTIFHEVLNKHGHTYDITVGAPIQSEDLDGDPLETVQALQAYVEFSLRKDRKARYRRRVRDSISAAA